MHRMEVRVYYEDTDMAGIVYHANYLKFIERARSDWVRLCGIDQTRLKAEQGIVFAVRRIEADFLAPARFDEVLEVVTEPLQVTGARLRLRQEVWRGGARLFSALVELAALGEGGRPARLPAALRTAAGGQA